MRGSNTYPLFFDDCEVPAENVLGGEGKLRWSFPSATSAGTLEPTDYGVAVIDSVVRKRPT